MAFLASIFGRFALTRVGRALSTVPRWLWIALAALVVVVGSYWLHGRAVRSAYDAAYLAGVNDTERKWNASLNELEAEVAEWRTKYETAAERISTEKGARFDADIRNNAARADDLRVRGPGAAEACGRPGGDTGLSTSSGGRAEAARAVDAVMAGLPAGGYATVPWSDLVGYGEACDANRSEVIAWRSWHSGQAELLKQYKESLPKLSK